MSRVPFLIGSAPATAVAVAALAGLLGACQGAPTGDGELPAAEDPVLAQVDGKAIRESQVDTRLQDFPALARPEYSSPIGKRRLLEQMIEEQILYRAAVEDGLEKDPAIASQLEAGRRQVLSQAYLDHRQKLATQVSEKEARTFYEEHLDEYTIERTLRVRILNNTSERIVQRAREMVLDESVPFPAVCSKFNQRPAVIEAQGLLPTWVRKGRAVAWFGNNPEFHEAAFALEVGGVSEVFETVHGFNVVLVQEERAARQRSFEEARPDIVGRISRARGVQGLPDLIAELKERYHVQMLEAPGRSPEELFAAAQAAPGAAQKVELFQELVELYPEDSRVVEALFMIGFTRSEELNDAAGAETAFQRVMDEFPDSELAQSARWMLFSEEGEVPAFEQDGNAAGE